MTPMGKTEGLHKSLVHQKGMRCVDHGRSSAAIELHSAAFAAAYGAAAACTSCFVVSPAAVGDGSASAAAVESF